MTRPRPRSFDVFCSVRVAHTFEDLSARVDLEGDVELGPGDRVVLHGPPPAPPYGEVRVERRRATVTRASALARAWARLAGDLDCLRPLDES